MILSEFMIIIVQQTFRTLFQIHCWSMRNPLGITCLVSPSTNLAGWSIIDRSDLENNFLLTRICKRRFSSVFLFVISVTRNNRISTNDFFLNLFHWKCYFSIETDLQPLRTIPQIHTPVKESWIDNTSKTFGSSPVWVTLFRSWNRVICYFAYSSEKHSCDFYDSFLYDLNLC